MELRPLLRMIRKWLWLLVVAGLVGGLAGLGVAALQPKVYQAEAVVYVSTPSRSDWNNVIGDQQAAKAFASFPTATPVLNATLKAVGDSQTTANQLAGQITVNNTRDTQFVAIQVRGNDPQRVARLANEVANQAITAFANQTITPENLKTRDFVQAEAVRLESQIKDLETQIDTLKTRQAATNNDSGPDPQAAAVSDQLFKLNEMLNWLQLSHQQMVNSYASLNNSQPRLMQEASVPSSPIGSGPWLAIVTGLLAALVVIVGIIVVVEQTDEVMRTPTRIAQATGLPTFITVRTAPAHLRFPLLPRTPTRLGPGEALDRARLPEAFLTLGAVFQAQQQEIVHYPGSLLVTSPENGDGKTQIAAQIALGLARVGRDVVLVDGNLRAPSVHTIFGLSNQTGLTTLLKEEPETDLEEVLQKTREPHLQILAAGPASDASAELLSSPRLGQIIGDLSAHGLVVIDSPAVLTSSDPVILATRSDSILVVVDAQHTGAVRLNRSLEILKRVNTNVIGVVLNRAAA